MSNLTNRVQLIGNLGQAPIITNLEGGKKIAKFSIATSESYVNKQGEKITDTHWHNIVAWNKTAEIIEKFVAKGNKVGVDGKLTTRSWDDKDGTKRYTTEVVCSEILLLTPKDN